jgi:photosystem II stability/assembly factor-like uncharacterized protein
MSDRSMRLPHYLAILALLVPTQSRVQVTPQQTGVTNRFIAVSAVSENVVWISGDRGAYSRTTNGGVAWTSAIVPGAERLDFRDVHAFSDKSALLMSAGNGAASKIYRTTDAGSTWQLVFTNPDTAGFYDCMDFFDASRGLVIGDSYGGQMAVLSTVDGGQHWTRIPGTALPAPIQGEGSFASSGTCLHAHPDGSAWGVTTKGRVIRTRDFGTTWTVSVAMTSTTDTVGLTSVAFRDANTGYVFGGFGARASDTLVYATADGGTTWMTKPRPPNGHGIWAGALTASRAIIAVGPKGAAYSRDAGTTWTQVDSVNYWGVGVAPGSNIGWAVGRGGRVTKLSGF